MIGPPSTTVTQRRRLLKIKPLQSARSRLDGNGSLALALPSFLADRHLITPPPIISLLPAVIQTTSTR